MKECPRCHERTLEEEDAFNALSRCDNETYICSGCGGEETMIDLGELEADSVERDFVAAHPRDGR